MGENTRKGAALVVLSLPIIVMFGLDKIVYLVTQAINDGPKLSYEVYYFVTSCDLELTDVNRWSDFVAMIVALFGALLYMKFLFSLDFGPFRRSADFKVIFWLALGALLLGGFLFWKAYTVYLGENCNFITQNRSLGRQISQMSPLFRDYSIWAMGALYHALICSILLNLAVTKLPFGRNGR